VGEGSAEDDVTGGVTLQEMASQVMTSQEMMSREMKSRGPG